MDVFQQQGQIPQRVKLLAFLLIPGIIVAFRNLQASKLALDGSWGNAFINEAQDAPSIRSSSNSSSRPVDSSSIPLIPLEKLARHNTVCPDGLLPIESAILPQSATHQNRKIPKIIHITSRNRCATQPVIDNLNKWRFANHTVIFHDDDAVDALFRHSYSRRQFPTLRDGLKCVTSGATKSDIWRYLVLYLYGGIYSDIDNTPMKFDGETIKPTDESFFVIEQLGIMAQYFLASEPGHPLMRYVLETGVERLKGTSNVMVNNPAQMTGPGALKVGFIRFMAAVGYETTGYIEAGKFVGPGNRTVTVIGAKNNSKEYINRGGLNHKHKMDYYKKLGIQHFSEQRKGQSKKGVISCMEHLRRTNGTDKVGNYRYVKKLQRYVEINNETIAEYNLTRKE